MTEQLVKTNQNSLILAGIDTTGMTEVEVQELATILGENFNESGEGIDFRPQRYKINKDAQVFVDPFNKSLDELRGVVLFKQKVRGYWEEGNKIPLCSSFDANGGIDANGNHRKCASCPQNAWGSGKDGKGKECKEMRRIFLMTKEIALPIQVSFPPTSISEIDNFFSARITNGISDIRKEVKFTLTKKENRGYTFAAAVLKNGDEVPPKDIIAINDIRKKFVDGWRNIAIEEEDYGAEDGATEGAGDSNEPY